MTQRYRWVVGGALALYWVALCIVTHLPPSELPKTHVSDKVEHFCAYGLLSALLCAAVPITLRRTWWTSALLLAIAGLYGALDENTQPWFSRTCDLRDWYADMAGATAAIIAMSLIVRALLPSPLYAGERVRERGYSNLPGADVREAAAGFDPSSPPSPLTTGERE